MVRDLREAVPTTAYRQLAATLDELYRSEQLLEDASAALGEVLAEQSQITDESEDLIAAIAALMGDSSRDALFRLRNGIITNKTADIEPGDVIWMTSARDSSVTIRYRVGGATPTDVTCYVQQTGGIENGEEIPTEEWQPSSTDFSAGHILFDDRFRIDRE